MKRFKVKIGYLIALLVVIIGVGGYLVYEKTDLFREFPNYPRSLEGEDPISSMAFDIKYNGDKYSDQSLRIETFNPLNDEQATELEESIGGVVCGGVELRGAYVYSFCFSPRPRNGEELWDTTFKAEKFDFVKSAKPRIIPTTILEAT